MSAQIACGISGFGITEDEPVGIQFLKEGFNPRLRDKLPTGSLAEDSSFPAFRPFFPPVYGTFDEYWQVKDVVRSKTVDILEELFRTDIITAFSIIGESYGEPYSSRSSLRETYDGNAEALDKVNHAMEVEDLEGLGFIISTLNDGTTACMYGDYVLNRTKDGVWSYQKLRWDQTFEMKATSVETALYELARREEIYPGYAPENHAAMALILEMSAMVFHPEVLKQLKHVDPELTPREKDRFLEGWSKLFNMDAEATKRLDDWSMFPFELDEFFINRYTGLRGFKQAKKILDYGINGADEVWEMRNIVWATNSSGRQLRPTIVVEETGNEEEFAAIHEAINVLNARRRALAYDGEDDEAEDE